MNLNKIILALYSNSLEASVHYSALRRETMAQAISDRQSKSNGEKEQFWITSQPDGRWKAIQTRDSGANKLPDTHSRILPPFFTTKEVERGVGQRVAILQGMIENKYIGSIGKGSRVGRGGNSTIRRPVCSNQGDGL